MELPTDLVEHPAFKLLAESDLSATSDPSQLLPEQHAALLALRQKYQAETLQLTELVVQLPLVAVTEQLAWMFLAGANFDVALAEARITSFLDTVLAQLQQPPKNV